MSLIGLQNLTRGVLFGGLLVPIWYTMAVAKVFHLVRECLCVLCACEEGRDREGEGGGKEKEEKGEIC